MPELVTGERDEAMVSRAAAGEAFDVVRRVDLVLDTWVNHPPTVLRTGGLSVRDLRATATLLHVDERTAGFLVELAASAGLLATASPGDLGESWMPTDAYDSWHRASAAQRWTTLCRAWLASARVSALIGAKDSAGRARSEEHTSELQSLMRHSYAVFCLKKKT